MLCIEGSAINVRNKNETTYQPMTFDAIKIGLASPEKIREWSHGEVLSPRRSTIEH